MTVHDSHIQSISGRAIRFPYVTCPGAEAGLNALAGKPLHEFSATVHRETETRFNCTHLLDLAGLCSSHILLGVWNREYDIFVSDRDDGTIRGKYDAYISQDEEPLLNWHADYETILEPDTFKNVNLRKGFAKWAFEHLSPNDREAALALRRCSMISMGRAKKLEDEVHAADWGFCYSQQKERARDALRVPGTIKDFSDESRLLCLDDEAWINFRDVRFGNPDKYQENA